MDLSHSGTERMPSTRLRKAKRTNRFPTKKYRLEADERFVNVNTQIWMAERPMRKRGATDDQTTTMMILVLC